MHEAVIEWVQQWATDAPLTALDIGGRDINGHARSLFPHATWDVLDCTDGPGVTIVADAAAWRPTHDYDLVLCTEVFEHVENWRQIVATAYWSLAPGGRLIATCAAPGRPVHSGVDGELRLLPGEWYRNVEPNEMVDTLTALGFGEVTVASPPYDVQASATRP